MLLLCPVQGPWASSFQNSAEIRVNNANTNIFHKKISKNPNEVNTK